MTAPHTAVLQGVPVVPGVRFAPVIRANRLPRIDEIDIGGVLPEADRPAEAARFAGAASSVAQRLRDRAALASGAASEVLGATAQLAQDRAWLGSAENALKAGKSAVRATAEAAAQFIEVFTTMGGLMAERVTDLKDIRDRVIAELAGLPEPGVPVPAEPSILCAEDLAPADTAGLDPHRVVGLATVLGGPTSHTAIIARQLGIPCVVAVHGLGEVAAGTPVLLDGNRGTVTVNPDRVAAAAAVAAADVAAAAMAGWTGPGATADGHPVAIMANVADGSAARAARRAPVEGVGLFRTELCFLERDSEPTVAEQAAIYAEVLEAFAGHKVVIRTLDAGSDKPLKFVTNPEEARRFADLARERGLYPGVMIEVPAAALLADRILEHVEFLSIGTNDLAQYTMAADRMSSDLAGLTDPWQPGVIALVAETARAGAAVGKPVGVCGEAAADPLLACVLTGLGVTSLSAAASAVTPVGAKLASVSLRQCRDAAEAVLATAGPAEARAVARAVLG